MQVKSPAVLDPPSNTVAADPARDRSAPARCAGAIALYRVPDRRHALAEQVLADGRKTEAVRQAQRAP